MCDLWVSSPLLPVNPFMTRQASRRESGSIPAVGSSRSTTVGFPMNAMANDNLRFWPPLNVPAGLSRSSQRPTAFNFSSISFETKSESSEELFGLSTESTPRSGLNETNSSRCSFTVREGQSTSNWGHTPICATCDLLSIATSTPSIHATPES